MTIAAMSWEQYWTEAGALAGRLRPAVPPGATRLWLPALPVRQGLLLLGACWHLGLEPQLDEKAKAPGADATLFVAPSEYYQESGVLDGLLLTGARPPELWQALQGLTVWFCTSGSTAEPKPVAKSMVGLLREIAVLQELYALAPGATVVSLVRPFHIYGFLHAYLLPLAAGASVLYWPHQQALPQLADGFPATVALLVMVPAHWRLVQYIWGLSHTASVVTSGAPFGPQRSQELLALPRAFDRVYEILGSTETGGIGYRRVESSETLFTLFAGVSLQPDRQGTLVHSPFLAPDTAVVTADVLESVGPQRFLHLGRSDRVFKYAGVRHSLTEIEAHLSALCAGAAVVCRFLADDGIAQGGILEAWIEAVEPEQVQRLRGLALASSKAPFPQRVHILAALPRDAQGKVSLEALKEAQAKAVLEA